MWVRRFLFIWLGLLIACGGYAQQDDTNPPPDTLAIYKKIKEKAYRYRFTRFLFHAVFIDPSPARYDQKPLSDQQKKENPLLRYSGKVIRSIRIEVYDPFGYSVNDTVRTSVNYFQRIGNLYHITTRKRIIRNLLLFKTGDTLELIKLTESERLVRHAEYVNDARIYVDYAGKNNTDSIDIKVMVQDKWTLGVSGSLLRSSGDIHLVENNLFGSGQRYGQYVKYSLGTGWEFLGRHTIANISRSFISSNVYYFVRPNAGYTGFAFDRAFYSPLAKWAGGLAAVSVWDEYTRSDTNGTAIVRLPVNYYNTDTWIGRSIRIPAVKWVNKKLTNIVAAVRYAGTWYSDRPATALDTGHAYYNQELFLASLGFSLSKYYKDQYIFRFGANEDIPEGLLIQAVGGQLYREFSGKRYYAGLGLSRGRHFERLGYFSMDAVYGVFFRKGIPNDGTINLGLTYFTDLFRTQDRWYYRQFAYVKYVSGMNKAPTEKITIRTDELYGFRAGPAAGKTKIMLNLESVVYAPYNLVGFRFAPVALIGLGMLSEHNATLFRGCVYQSYALGLLMRNESLLNGTFKITLGFYPNLPGDNQQYRYNPVTTFTIRIKNFAVARPELAAYY